MKKEREEAFRIFLAHQGDQADTTAVQVCQTRKCMFPSYLYESQLVSAVLTTKNNKKT